MKFVTITMTTFLLVTLDKIKYWNSFIINILSPTSTWIYKNSMLFVYDLSFNIISLVDLSSNSLF